MLLVHCSLFDTADERYVKARHNMKNFVMAQFGKISYVKPLLLMPGPVRFIGACI